MVRQRLGAHGKVIERLNGSQMMTIRPEPSVYTDEDLAMLIGRELGIQRGAYWSDPNNEMSRADAIETLYEYENDHGVMTQSKFVKLVNDPYYMALYDMGSDTHEIFCGEEAHHIVLLEFVHRVFPAFKNQNEESE